MGSSGVGVGANIRRAPVHREIATQTRDLTFEDHVPAQLSEHGLGDFGCKHKVHEIKPALRQSGLGLYLPKRRPGGVDPPL